MKSQIHFRKDKDLLLAILVGVVGGLVALAMFFLSGYMVTQSALGAPLYALMVLVVSVKMFGFLRAITRYIERLLSHRTTFTMLRDVRVQFLKKLIPAVLNFSYGKPSRGVTKYLFKSLLSPNSDRFNCNRVCNYIYFHFTDAFISYYVKYDPNSLYSSMAKC